MVNDIAGFSPYPPPPPPHLHLPTNKYLESGYYKIMVNDSAGFSPYLPPLPPPPNQQVPGVWLLQNHGKWHCWVFSIPPPPPLHLPNNKCRKYLESGYYKIVVNKSAGSPHPHLFLKTNKCFTVLSQIFHCFMVTCRLFAHVDLMCPCVFMVVCQQAFLCFIIAVLLFYGDMQTLC